MLKQYVRANSLLVVKSQVFLYVVRVDLVVVDDQRERGNVRDQLVDVPLCETPRS